MRFERVERHLVGSHPEPRPNVTREGTSVGATVDEGEQFDERRRRAASVGFDTVTVAAALRAAWMF